MSDNILDANSVTKRFGGLIAVNDVNFIIPRGAIVSIIGPNGAGKTTFFNCITGFYRIDEGDIVFDGESIAGLEPYQITKIGIARTFQNIRLFANMSAIENIMVGQESHLKSSWIGAIVGTPGTRREESAVETEARRLLDFVGLRGKGDTLAAQSALWRPAAAGDRARTGGQAQAPVVRRADRRHESARNSTNDRLHSQTARRTGHHNLAHRT